MTYKTGKQQSVQPTQKQRKFVLSIQFILHVILNLQNKYFGTGFDRPIQFRTFNHFYNIKKYNDSTQNP